MKRVEVLLDPAVVADLDRIAYEAGTDRSFLIRKAVGLYLAHRKPTEGSRPGAHWPERVWLPDDE